MTAPRPTTLSDPDEEKPSPSRPDVIDLPAAEGSTGSQDRVGQQGGPTAFGTGDPAITQPDGVTDSDFAATGAPRCSSGEPAEEAAGDPPGGGPLSWTVQPRRRHHPRVTLRRPRLGRFIYWITGYEDTAQPVRAERLFFGALGFAVLVTSGMAAVSAMLTLHAAAPSWWWPWYVPAAFGWSLVVFMVELLIVRQIHYSGKGLGAVAPFGAALVAFLVFLTRAALALAVAFLVAEPAITYLFNDKVAEQIVRDHQAKAEGYRSQLLLDRLTDWQRRQNGAMLAARDTLTRAADKKAYWAAQIRKEDAGVGDCSAEPGHGPCYQRAQAELIRSDQALTAAQNACTEAVTAAEGDLRTVLGDVTRQADQFALGLPGNSGIFDRITALRNIEAQRHGSATGSDSGGAAPTRSSAGSESATDRPAALSTVLPTCDTTQELPTPEDVRTYVTSRTLSSAKPGTNAQGVTRDEATSIFQWHILMLLLLVLVDLFPLFTKQILWFSAYSQRAKLEAQDAAAGYRNISERRAVQRKAELADAQDEVEWEKRHRTERRRRQQEQLRLEREARIAERQAQLQHEAELSRLRREDEQATLRRELGLSILFPNPFRSGQETTPADPPASNEIWTPAPGAVVNDRWGLIRELTTRDYAFLWLAQEIRPGSAFGQPLPSREVVVKLLRVLEEDRYHHELAAVTALPSDAPYIAPILDAGSISSPVTGGGQRVDWHFVVQPHYRLGNLDYYLDRRRPPTLRFCLALAEQLLTGISSVHTTPPHLLHLDIKPGNVVMAEIHPREHAAFIIDWGISALVEGTAEKTGRAVGTQFFSAPEQFLRRRGDGSGRYFESDIYGVGATLYYLCTGQKALKEQFDPYLQNNDQASWRGFLLTRPRPTPMTDVLPTIPQALSDLVQQWLSANPGDRVPAEYHDKATAAGWALSALRRVTSQLDARLLDTIVGRAATADPTSTCKDIDPSGAQSGGRGGGKDDR